MATQYQIYALKYGERETKEGQFFFREASQTSDASHFYRNIERRDPVQIITNLPQMLAGFETIDALAGSKDRVVVGHDPEVATRFEQVEPGIIKIA